MAEGGGRETIIRRTRRRRAHVFSPVVIDYNFPPLCKWVTKQASFSIFSIYGRFLLLMPNKSFPITLSNSQNLKSTILLLPSFYYSVHCSPCLPTDILQILNKRSSEDTENRMNAWGVCVLAAPWCAGLLRFMQVDLSALTEQLYLTLSAIVHIACKPRTQRDYSDAY